MQDSDAGDQPRMCACGKAAVQLTVVKEGNNKGRKFWRCSQDQECKFFEWGDEPPKGGQSGAGRGDMGGGPMKCFKVILMCSRQI
jgi:DNA topoisomerase-3